MKKIILASASPRRSELLSTLGVEFETYNSDIDESLLEGEGAVVHTRRLAREKARKAAEHFTDGHFLIIGADTTVVVGSELLGKPRDGADAARMLRLLSKKTHSVVTAFSILDTATGKEITEDVETRVSVKDLTEEEISDYIATGEPTDKAGSYAIQGKGKFIAIKTVGSYSNVVGLPTEELTAALKKIL